MHACEVALEVDIGRVLIPRVPGHFSALGMLQANLRFDKREVFAQRLEHLDIAALNAALSRIRKELAGIVGGDGGHRLRFSYGLALRYQGQEHTLMIQSPVEGADAPADVAGVFRELFEAEYLRRFGHKHENAPVEIDEIEMVAERELPSSALTLRAEKSAEKSGDMDVYFSQTGSAVRTPIIPRTGLEEGATFEGPMIIYENGSNTVIPPGAKGRVAKGGHLMIDISGILRTGR
jgi:N-methylhydantoinase A